MNQIKFEFRDWETFRGIEIFLNSVEVRADSFALQRNVDIVSISANRLEGEGRRGVLGVDTIDYAVA